LVIERAIVANSEYHRTSSCVGPEMISGVRASSIRMESTSSVGDVGSVGHAALVGAHLRQDDADGQAEELVHAAHPLGVVLREVVVDGDHVHTVAGERVEVRRQGRDQGLALAGLHLGDVAEVQGRAAHHLDVVVPLAEHPLGGLPDGRERLGHQVVEGLALGQAAPELRGLSLQVLVAHGDEVLLDGVHGTRDRLELPEDLALADAEDLVEDGRHVRSTPVVGVRVAPGRGAQRPS
jgi:hypothetical protein